MASFAAARSALRSGSARSVASRLAPQTKSGPSAFRAFTRTPLYSRPLRCPVEASFCLESMLPYHTATASAVLNSLLTTSSLNLAWLIEGQ